MNVKKNIALPAIMVGTFILEGVFSLQFANGLFNDRHLFIPHFFTYYVDDYDLFL